MARIIIVGAGFGGLNAARALKNASADVLVIDRNNHHVFQPLLYQVATAGLSPAEIAVPIRSILRNQPNTEVIMAEVTGVDLKLARVFTQHGEFSFDYLILATGASHSYFGHDEWAKNAPGLKTISDATGIRTRILLAFEKAEMEKNDSLKHEYLHFVIVGGGPTGVELAGSIAELAHRVMATDFRHIRTASAKITLIEAGERILSSFPADLSTHATRALERLGVQVVTGCRVTRVNEEGVWVGEKHFRSKTVIWAAGVVASPVSRWLGVEADRQGRVKVEQDLSLPEHPNVFIVGDCARFEDKIGEPLPAVAPVAMQEGDFVARLIMERLRGKKVARSFKYRDKGNLATIGRSSAICVIGKIKLRGFVAWLTWLVVHIFYLIGFKNRVIVMLQWAWAYIAFQRGARIITQERGK